MRHRRVIKLKENVKEMTKERCSGVVEIMFTVLLSGAGIHLQHSDINLMNNDLSQIGSAHTFAVCHAI